MVLGCRASITARKVDLLASLCGLVGPYTRLNVKPSRGETS